ncbi:MULTISPECIES: GntR family transcriptional regulator [Pseudonocardia]|uniref:HTH-type transcriptional repressor YvoA n=2 Tax=Pseudonocardia TaxID=1847 RepID=A0A1Y2MZW1_PSEAH|nr:MULTISPECIES: GntR family transcriptional regulator [Pseudonocardia]OSY40725.1 HTH-type transcriptional repressor YvoA [Pseudonocardia autotrophica]TDN71968.1 GntR family transcriptional regulator [Pseudonocardia autotrophica]BBG02655.1 GntR family transcriptional regulator [Pseudonocardia autotrophica]GEC24714.1 GntR family transcriptional regulator [Pseudonocardia saturnea]
MATRSEAVQLDVVLDRASPVPLYHQLAQAIEAAIDRGVLRPGDRLENEIALTERLGLARPTARQAIQELVRKGLLVRRRGLGTQVVQPAIHRDVRLTSLYEDLTDAGRTPETRLLAHEPCTPGTAGVPALSELLPADEPLQMLRRVRLADGEPLSIMTNYLPARFELDDAVLGQRGLYALLREQGAQVTLAYQTIGARLELDDEAALLGGPNLLACVTAELTVYDDAGALVELGRHVYRADRYTVQTSLII